MGLSAMLAKFRNKNMKTDEIEPQFVLVLTARGEITDDVIDNLNQTISDYCGQFVAGRRLGNVAFEYELNRNYDGLCKALSSHYGTAEIDFNIVPRNERKKQLLLADMDATLIVNECIDELADVAGNRDQISVITEQAMTGEIDFNQSLVKRVALLKGVSESALHEIYNEEIKLNPGAQILGRTLAKFGVETVLVSGGFSIFANRIAKSVGFTNAYSNQLEIENGALTGNIKQPVMGPQGKPNHSRKFYSEKTTGADTNTLCGRWSQRYSYDQSSRTGSCIPCQTFAGSKCKCLDKTR